MAGYEAEILRRGERGVYRVYQVAVMWDHGAGRGEMAGAAPVSDFGAIIPHMFIHGMAKGNVRSAQATKGVTRVIYLNATTVS